MSKEPDRPISETISHWLRAMGSPETDVYDLNALRDYLVAQTFSLEAIETELQLWLKE